MKNFTVIIGNYLTITLNSMYTGNLQRHITYGNFKKLQNLLDQIYNQYMVSQKSKNYNYIEHK